MVAEEDDQNMVLTVDVPGMCVDGSLGEAAGFALVLES